VFKLVVAGVLASGAGNGLRYRRTGYLCLAALGLVILVVSSASAHPMKALWKLIPQLRREQVVPHLGHRAAPVRPAIINGTAATDGFPWLAFVAQTDGSTYFDSCTGSVVAPNWILLRATAQKTTRLARSTRLRTSTS
jgi:hypothetical protein